MHLYRPEICSDWHGLDRDSDGTNAAAVADVLWGTVADVVVDDVSASVYVALGRGEGLRGNRLACYCSRAWGGWGGS